MKALMTEQMKSYGYTGKMVPYASKEAMELWKMNKITVYKLHPDNTRTPVTSGSEFTLGSIFGIDREAYMQLFPFVTAMELRLKMDRPISENDHYISPGGYELCSMDGENISFDFMSYVGKVDQENPDELYCEIKKLDLDSFPDALASLTKDFIDKLGKIAECYVYTGENENQEINLRNIVSWKLTFSDDTQYVMPESVLQIYKV